MPGSTTRNFDQRREQVMSETNPPPSIEALRDKLCEEYLDYECYAMDGTGPHRDTFKAGFDAALQELSRRAEGEFDHTAAYAEYEKRFEDIGKDMGFTDGARWQHQRDWARIQELEAEASRYREALERIAETLGYEYETEFEDTEMFRTIIRDLCETARAALSGGGEHE